jgi:hypothetical protein
LLAIAVPTGVMTTRVRETTRGGYLQPHTKCHREERV